jgi:hypothetical protein
MLDGQTIKRCSTAHAALAELAADPALLPTCRKAVRGCLSTLQAVEQRQKSVHLKLVQPREPRPDVRSRQLPVGDRDGGHDDAA